MTFKQSDRVREIILEKYVKPARRNGSETLTIRARDVLKDAEATSNFPRGRTPLVCNVLQSNKLFSEAGLELQSIEGPPSKQSRTVVAHYRVLAAPQGVPPEIVKPVLETPSERAHRLTESVRGLLKDEIAAFGGTEAFMRWVRSNDDEQDAA
jgi:hypothetical protein